MTGPAEYNRARDDAKAMASIGHVFRAAHLLRDQCGMPLDEAFIEALEAWFGDVDIPLPGELPICTEFDHFSARRADA